MTIFFLLIITQEGFAFAKSNLGLISELIYIQATPRTPELSSETEISFKLIDHPVDLAKKIKEACEEIEIELIYFCYSKPDFMHSSFLVLFLDDGEDEELFRVNIIKIYHGRIDLKMIATIGKNEAETWFKKTSRIPLTLGRSENDETTTCIYLFDSKENLLSEVEHFKFVEDLSLSFSFEAITYTVDMPGKK
jgi:hypothetical protein